MKKFILSFLTAVIFLLTSCSKEDFSINIGGSGGGYTWNLPTFNSSSFDISALGYIRLPADRYYIYKDPSTGFTDSVVVTQSMDSSAVQAAGAGYAFGYIYSIYKLTMTNFTTSVNQVWYTGTAFCDFPAGYVLPSSGPASVIDSNFTLSGGPGNLPAFWSPFTISGINQYTYIPSMTIEGTTYYKVNSFFSTNGLPSTDTNYQATLFCWVKGIGIIKREIKTYNTVKTSLLVRFG